MQKHVINTQDKQEKTTILDKLLTKLLLKQIIMIDLYLSRPTN